MNDFSIFMLIIMPATLLALGGIVLLAERRSDQKYDAFVRGVSRRLMPGASVSGDVFTDITTQVTETTETPVVAPVIPRRREDAS